MRLFLFCYLSFVSVSVSAQTTSDSSFREATTKTQLIKNTDSLHLQIHGLQKKLDSLRQLPGTPIDRSKTIRYVIRQRDSVSQQVQRWEARKGNLLSPLDSLQQKINASKHSVNTFQDTLIQYVPICQVLDPLKGEADLPEEVTRAIPSSSINKILSSASLPKLTSQLPNLPPPVHAVREHAAVWQEKLSIYPATLSEYQDKASSYTSAVDQGSEALEQQVLQHAPESELLQTGGSSEGQFDFSNREAFAQQQQRAQLQQRVIASAKDHFAEHGEVLRDAQQQLGKLKKKYSMVQGDNPPEAQ